MRGSTSSLTGLRDIVWDIVAATLVTVASLFLCLAARADIWVIDKKASVVHFSYDHFGVSKQSGRFVGIDGRLEFSPTDPEQGSVDIKIRANSISTGVTELDTLLRSVDFFNAPRHPEIGFASTAVRKTGERTGEIDGVLTMLGVSNPVTLEVTWNYTGEYPLSSINPAYQGKWVSGFSGKTTIERAKWGMKRGIPLLSDEVEIRVEVEFLKAD